MTDKPCGDTTAARAASLINVAASLINAAETDAEAEGAEHVSLAARQTLTDAVAHDLGECNSAQVAEARMAKVETQTRVLAEAVIAFSEPAQPADGVASAVQAVKDEM